jgi:hypothetical protein
VSQGVEIRIEILAPVRVWDLFACLATAADVAEADHELTETAAGVSLSLSVMRAGPVHELDLVVEETARPTVVPVQVVVRAAGERDAVHRLHAELVDAAGDWLEHRLPAGSWRWTSEACLAEGWHCGRAAPTCLVAGEMPAPAGRVRRLRRAVAWLVDLVALVLRQLPAAVVFAGALARIACTHGVQLHHTHSVVGRMVLAAGRPAMGVMVLVAAYAAARILTVVAVGLDRQPGEAPVRVVARAALEPVALAVAVLVLGAGWPA